MSFSKARIQRFNDVASEAPPPGAYDPKFDNKIKGLVIEKSERFQDGKSIGSGSTECNLSVSNKSIGIPAVAVFRTPQLPKKRIVSQPLSCPKAKWKTVNPGKDHKSQDKYETQQEVADLKVERMNKDKTIREQEKHIEELKETGGRLEKQLEEFQKHQNDVEEQHRRDIEAMAKLQTEVLNAHDEKHRIETETMRSQLLQLSEEKECEIGAMKATENSLKVRINELVKREAYLEKQLATGNEDRESVGKLKTFITESQEKQNQLAAQLNETRQSKEKDITDLKNRLTEKDGRLINAEKEVQDLLRQNETLAISLRKITEDRDLNIKSAEVEKLQFAREISELKSERSSIVIKLENRQKVILELQAQLSALQCELDELKAEYDKLIDDSNNQLSEVIHSHAEDISRLKESFARERELLSNENQLEETRRLQAEDLLKGLDETNLSLMQELENLRKLYKDSNEELKESRSALENSKGTNLITIEEHEKEMQKLSNIQEEERIKFQQLLDKEREIHLKEMGNVMIAREKELAEVKAVSTRKLEEETKRIKEHADRVVENAETVTRETLAACRAESEEKVKKVIAESDVRVNWMIQEARNAVEEDMRLDSERYKACLERVEMERSALDEKLSQRDAEINSLSATLEELKSSAETQESFSQSLQIELDKAETELAEKKEELRTLKDQIRAEAAEMVARRRRFEVVMTENQSSVAVLTQRLAESHAEVEKLQNKLNHGEKCIDEHRDLLSAMRNNSQLVHDQVRALTEQLNAKGELVNQLAAGSLHEMESMKAILDAKIDQIKEIATKEIMRLQSECNMRTDQNLQMKKQLEEMIARLTDAQSMLLNLEEKHDMQTVEISKMQLHNDKLQDQLNVQIQSMEEHRESLRVQSLEHEKALQEANTRAAELSAKVQSFNERDKRLIEQLDSEKRRRNMAEAEMKSLKENNDSLLNEYQLLNEKYAEVIGHQNHKQRIKHVAQLKDKIERLEQELQVKVKLLEQQQKIIDKLKVEEKRGHSKGKENAPTLQKSAHTTPVSSPHKPWTPLRNRNE